MKKKKFWCELIWKINLLCSYKFLITYVFISQILFNFAGIEMEVIDKCETDNGGCEHDCRYVDGHAMCFCQSGYRLEADQTSCIGIN